jgi:hypothetical protein
MGKDEVFKGEIEKASDFKFGENVARVFDDMVNRSVPYYGEIQRMMAEIAADHAREGAYVYDLGCSTGTTMVGMDFPGHMNYAALTWGKEYRSRMLLWLFFASHSSL